MAIPYDFKKTNYSHMKKVIIVLLIVIQSGIGFSQNFGNELFSLSQIKEGVKSKRVGSYDKTGGNGDCLKGIKSGEKATIMDVKGAGVISHIWITIAPERINSTAMILLSGCI